MPNKTNCMLCDRTSVVKWTMSNGTVAVVADLCLEHSEPFSEIVRTVGPKPPTRAGELKTAEKKTRLEPLKWTPPAPPPLRLEEIQEPGLVRPLDWTPPKSA